MTPVSTSPPHELQLVIDFVNTADLETGTDELARPSDLGAWLVAHELCPRDSRVPTAAEHAAAVELRGALRAILLAHNGHPAAPDAGEILDRAATRGGLSVRFRADGGVGVAPRTRGVPGALAALLVPVAAAAADGSWERVKACHAGDCQWAFYDASRNRSGRWCDMAVCGNRTKVRAYRSKRA